MVIKMELAIIIVIIALSFIYFRKINNVIYTICVLDILFRVITRLESVLNISEFSYYVNKYIPESIEQIINKYTSGTLNEVLIYVYIGIYVIFTILIIKGMFKKGRR